MEKERATATTKVAHAFGLEEGCMEKGMVTPL